MSQTIHLNNAISALDFRNQANAEVQQLAKDWVSWFNDVRPWVPSPVEYATLRYYWPRYRHAYASATNTTGVPTPAQVEPTMARAFNEDLSMRTEAFRDVGKAAQQSLAKATDAATSHLHTAARELRPSVLPVGIGLGAIAALGLVWATRRAA